MGETLTATRVASLSFLAVDFYRVFLPRDTLESVRRKHFQVLSEHMLGSLHAKHAHFLFADIVARKLLNTPRRRAQGVTVAWDRTEVIGLVAGLSWSTPCRFWLEKTYRTHTTNSSRTVKVWDFVMKENKGT